MNVRQRVVLPELMDDPDLDPKLHAHALRGLKRIHQWSTTRLSLLRAIRGVADRRELSQIRVLDVACGGGDLALELTASSRGRVVVDGCDLSPVAVAHAIENAQSRGLADCRFFTHDALRSPFPEGYDIICCTLFLHHLERQQAVQLLSQMAQAARCAVIVDDLIRSTVGYWLAWAGCRVLTRSPIVHHDGPVSVRAAHSCREALAIADQAGLSGATLSRHFPERFLLTWDRPVD